MTGRDALVVVVDVVDRGVTVRVATDAVRVERVVRRVVLRESLRLLSVAGLAEVVATLRLCPRMDTDTAAFPLLEYGCHWPPA
jgi:hypothetical protein